MKIRIRIEGTGPTQSNVLYTKNWADAIRLAYHLSKGE